MEFKTPLQELRITDNLTQQEVATGLNYNLRTYQEYERGNISIPFDEIPKIAHFFHVSADYLVGMTKERQPQVKTFSQATGLSEQSIAILQSIHNKENGNALIEIIDRIFTDSHFYNAIINIHNVNAIRPKINKELTEKGQQYATAVHIENELGNMKHVVTSGESYVDYLMLKTIDEVKQLFESVMKGEKDNGTR